MGKRIKSIGNVICAMTALMLIVSSCDKETVHDKILGTWTLTSDPSCTWTFQNKKCFITVDTFYAICFYQIENNVLSLTGNVENSTFNIEDTYLSVDDIDKNTLYLSGTVRLVDRIFYLDGGSSIRDVYNVPISYEFRKSN